MAFGFGQSSSSFAFGSSTPAFGAASAPAFSFPSASGGAFGAASSPSLFGAAASPSPFGAASTPAFSFGPTSTSAFGAPASTPAFGAASTPAFGASATPSFGAVSTPAFSGFSMPGFRAVMSTPAFGATSTPAFGASSMPAFGAMSAGAFGATAMPPFGAASTGGFSFGGALVPAGATASAFNWGGAAAAPPPPPAPAAPGMPALAAAGGPAEVAREVSWLVDAYRPGSAHFRFTHLFLSVVDTPSQRVKPPGVDEQRWRQALNQAGGPDNPERLWPVQAVGFSDLVSRRKAQEAALAEHRDRLAALGELAAALRRRHDGELAERVRAVTARHVELSQRVLHLYRAVDALEGKMAAYIGYQPSTPGTPVAELSSRLSELHSEVTSTAPGGLQRRLEGVTSALKLRAGAPSIEGVVASAQLDASSASSLFAVLTGHARALTQLQDVLREDLRKVALMRRERRRAMGLPADGDDADAGTTNYTAIGPV